MYDVARVLRLGEALVRRRAVLRRTAACMANGNIPAPANRPAELIMCMTVFPRNVCKNIRRVEAHSGAHLR
jgi:hypothetical protein